MYLHKHLIAFTLLACFLGINSSYGSPDVPVGEVKQESGEKTADEVAVSAVAENEDEDEVVKTFPKEPEPDVIFNEADYVDQPVDISQFPDLHVNNSRIYGRASCRCGVPPRGKIVNGLAAKIVDIPWTVGIVRSSFFVGPYPGQRPFCGGTLINNLYVVTASHCVDGKSPKSLFVWTKTEDLNNATSRSVVNVSSIIMHPEYSRRTVDNDIALLKLASPVDFDPTKSILAPACIPANNDNDFSTYEAVAAGWGAISGSGPQSTYLRKVTVPVMTNEKCNTDSQYKNRISPSMLCAGFLEGGKDACQGDSGGPLTIQNGERETLIGIVSWGYGCAKPKAPGVYTRVGRYPQWILENTHGADWCAE